jgi:hypothetical protein
MELPMRDGEPLAHSKIWELIPWLLNGRASAAERAAVDVHLLACADCRAEMAFQRDLHAAICSEPDEAEFVADPQAGLDRLFARIDAAEPGAVKARARSSHRAWLMPMMAAALLIETAGVAAWFGAHWQRTQAPAYSTLSTPSATPVNATLRVVLASDTRADDLQKLLQQSQLQIVGGPSEAGVYTLAPLTVSDAAQQQRTLEQLRGNASVRFAEPLAAMQ